MRKGVKTGIVLHPLFLHIYVIMLLCYYNIMLLSNLFSFIISNKNIDL